MVNFDKQCKEVEEMLNEIEIKIKKEWGEKSLTSKCGIERDILVGEDEVMGVLFVLPNKKEEVREKINELFPERKFSIAVFSLGVKEFIKKFVQEWKVEKRKDLKIGNEISNLEENGVAMYINWTNNRIIIHKYEKGKFLSKSCKKVPLWETSNGTWIVGFKNKEEAENFAKDLKKEIKEKFSKEYSLNFHSLCWEKEQ